MSVRIQNTLFVVGMLVAFAMGGLVGYHFSAGFVLLFTILAGVVEVVFLLGAKADLWDPDKWAIYMFVVLLPTFLLGSWVFFLVNLIVTWPR